MPSLIAAIAGLLIILPLANRYLSVQAALWAVALLAVSDNVLIYSTLAKPYTIDLLITSALLFAAIRLKDASPMVYILPLAVIAAVGFWLSYPSCLVYGGLAAMGLIKLLSSRRKRDWAGFLLANLVVAASILTMLYFCGNQRSDELMRFWGTRGFFQGFGLEALLAWPIDATYRMFEDAVRPIGFFVLGTFLIGVVAMWRDRPRRFQLGLLVMPLVCSFAAACITLYPWTGSRVSMWNIPIIVLLSAEGCAYACRTIPSIHGRRAFAIVAAAIIAVPLGLAVYNVAIVRHRHVHCRPMVRHVVDNFADGDHVAVAGFEEFRMYFQDMSAGRLEVDRDVTLPAMDVLDNPDWQRCWLLVRTDKWRCRQARDAFLGRFDKVDEMTVPYGQLYLLARR